jgi:hypothetical protein
VSESRVSTVDDFRAESCQGDHCCGLFHVFRLVYVLIMEVGTRRMLHCNVTHHPTTEWTMRQFSRMCYPRGGHQFIIHDRDRTYSSERDSPLPTRGLRVFRTPYRSQTNTFCKRLIGSARRECLDFMIPFDEEHIRNSFSNCGRAHYNRSRSHSSPGPGIPDPSVQKAELQTQRHCIPKDPSHCCNFDTWWPIATSRLERIAA